MQQMNPQDDDRCVLSSPTELPCESVSPTTLLTSLSCLAVNICNFKTSFFPTQRRNATETIRQVGVILNFLQEIREFPEHYSPCFSELHFYLHKILFLLQDCTRQGARMWMLLKSSDVASQFQLLTRGLAVALHRIEVKESVELLTKQVGQTKLQRDPDDERICKRTNLVLSELEGAKEPDFTDTKQVLDYMEIKTWADCDREIRFLQDEIAFRWYERDKLDIKALSGLHGLLCYCRVVIFEESETVELSERGRHRSRRIWDTFKADSTAESYAMMHISYFIASRLEYGTKEQKIKAACEMSLLTVCSKFNVDNLVGAGTVPHLLNLLSTDDKSMQENVFTALGNVSYLTLVQDAIMASSEGLKTIVRVLKEGLSPKSRASAAAIVAMLSDKIMDEEVISAEAIPCLVQLIKEGTSPEKKSCLMAIYWLLNVKKNYERVVEDNIVGLLVETLTLDSDEIMIESSLTVLHNLAKHESVGKEAVLKEWVELQPLIIGILKSTEIRRSKELCTCILRSLCESGNEDVKRGLAREYESIMPVLFSLYSDDTCDLRFHASSLITILQDYILH